MLRGTSATFNVGRESGSGTVDILNGSTVTVTSRLAAGESSLNIGREQNNSAGSIGAMSIDGSSMTITGGGGTATTNFSYGAYVTVGRGSATANGSLNVQNNATLTLNGTGGVAGQTAADTLFTIGRGGGTGVVNITGGADLVMNGGTEGAAILVGRAGTGGATLNDPRVGANGTLNVSGAGTTVVIDSGGTSAIQAGPRRREPRVRDRCDVEQRRRHHLERRERHDLRRHRRGAFRSASATQTTSTPESPPAAKAP